MVLLLTFKKVLLRKNLTSSNEDMSKIIKSPDIFISKMK